MIRGKPPRPGAQTFLVTFYTDQRRPLFRDPQFARLVVDSLFAQPCQGSFLLHEFVLLPDCCHLLLTPRVHLERAVQQVKGRSWEQVREQLNYRLPVWGMGFDYHRIRTAKDYQTYKVFVQRAALRAGLVQETEFYSFSSCTPAFAHLLDAWPPPRRARGARGMCLDSGEAMHRRR